MATAIQPQIRTIRILYDHQKGEHAECATDVRRLLNEKLRDQQIDVRIGIYPCPSSEVIKRSRKKWDMILIHLGGGELGRGKASAYSVARMIRRGNQQSILVADSSSHPEGREEVLGYFDDYIPRISLSCSEGFVRMLKEAHFIPQDFKSEGHWD